MDLYWVTKAGFDPRTWFARYPGRFELVHVKDSKGAPGHTMTEVGSGTMDWKGIFAQRRKAGIKHYFVEHDEPADPMESIRVSYNDLRALRF
jgi:sugar phosphate isomerase/epimerase